jgi:hypothetical protein
MFELGKWMQAAFRRITHLNIPNTAPQQPPITSFSQGANIAFEDYQRFREQGRTAEKNIAAEHQRVLMWPMHDLDYIRQEKPDATSPLRLTGAYDGLMADINHGVKTSTIKNAYTFMGLVLLLGETRKGFAYFSQTEEAEKVDDFDLVTFREQLEASSPTEDITKPDDVRDQTLKAWANDPFRLFGKELAARDNRDYLQLIGTIKMTLQSPTFVPFMQDLGRIDTRYTPPAYMDDVRSILAQEYPKAAPHGRPANGI